MRLAPSIASRSTSTTARRSPWSGPPAPERPPCCASSQGCCPQRAATFRSMGSRSSGFPRAARRIALVFQDDALFTHMSVRENLRFALRRRSVTSEKEIVETAAALHVAAHLDRRPRHLSGGERQRASIARALLSGPRALLLDEPLAHLDPSLRRSVRDEVVGVRQWFSGPILYVTHDHVEAMSVGHALAVLIDGRIEDIGQPQRVYDSPRTVAVARFLGERPMNLFEDGGLILGIRSERVRLAPDGAICAGAWCVANRLAPMRTWTSKRHAGASRYAYLPRRARAPATSSRSTCPRSSCAASIGRVESRSHERARRPGPRRHRCRHPRDASRPQSSALCGVRALRTQRRRGFRRAFAHRCAPLALRSVPVDRDRSGRRPRRAPARRGRADAFDDGVGRRRRSWFGRACGRTNCVRPAACGVHARFRAGTRLGDRSPQHGHRDSFVRQRSEAGRGVGLGIRTRPGARRHLSVL